MKEINVFKSALNSLYMYDEFKDFLIDDDGQNKVKLETISRLSKMHAKIAFFNGVIFLFDIALFTSSGVSIFIVNNFLQFNISTKFFYTLNGMAIGLLIFIFLIRCVVNEIIQMLAKSVLSGYRIKSDSGYTSYYGEGEKLYFLINDSYLDVPLSSIKVRLRKSRIMLDKSFTENGKLARVVNRNTKNEFSILLKVVE